jgi:hypothetical protein
MLSFATRTLHLLFGSIEKASIGPIGLDSSVSNVEAGEKDKVQVTSSTLVAMAAALRPCTLSWLQSLLELVHVEKEAGRYDTLFKRANACHYGDQ